MRALPWMLAPALLAITGPAWAQEGGGPRIGLTLEAAAATSRGGATAILPDPGAEVHLRASPSAALALRADLDWSRWRAELGVVVVPADHFAEFPDGGGIQVGGQELTLVELAPRLGLRLAGRPGAGTLRLLAGPALQLWSVTGEDSRVTVALGADLAAEAPLGSRLQLVVRGGVTAGPSYLAIENPDGGFVESTGVTRWQGGAGVRWLLRP